MTLSFGRKQLSIPGPTTVPDEVLQAMHRPAIDIYVGELVEMTDRILSDLKRVFRSPSGDAYIYTANGHGAWEAALSNTLSAGDAVLVLESGRFAPAWGETAESMGCRVETLHAEPGCAVDPSAVAARLAEDPGHEIKAILVVQIDTASGVGNDIASIGQAIRATDHPALFMVDGVASIGCVPFEMDEWGVDLAMTGSQKGLMTPPGLSFTVAGPRAKAAMPKAGLRTRYWDWEFREGAIFYQKFCGTPPEHLMFGLDRALRMLLDEEGLEAAWARHQTLAEATWDAVETWAAHPETPLRLSTPRRAERAQTVTTVQVADGFDAGALRAMTADRLGVTLGLGIGQNSEDAFRIAHMGHANAHSVLGALGAVETALQALGWPMGGSGLAAAAARMAEAVRA